MARRDWIAIMGAPRLASAEQAECRMTWRTTPFLRGMPAASIAARVYA